MSGYPDHAVLLVYRDQHATNPINTASSDTGSSGTNITMASISPTVTNTKLVYWAIIDKDNAAFTPAAGMTVRAEIGNTDKDAVSCEDQQLVNSGNAGSRTAVYGSSGTWIAQGLCIRGAEAGHYYRWKLDDARSWAYGIAITPNSESTAYQYGMCSYGYWVELRYPSSLGGTLPGNTYQMDVWNYQKTQHDVRTWEPGTMPWFGAYPCTYTQTPETIPPPPEDIPPGDCDVTVSTAGLAEELCKLRSRMDVVQAYLLNINALVAAMYGPYDITVGQAQENVTGHLGLALTQAAVAMSNYFRVADPPELVEEGVTGDWTTPTTAGTFYIHLTTVPSYAGKRAADPDLYEVNTRAEQLGWYMWGIGGAHTQWNRLVWADQVCVSPYDVAEDFYLHLADGVVASVYRLPESFHAVLI